MFDPTVFDNLRVVFEGAMYDLDLNGPVQITQRIDRVELATMSRSFAMEAMRKDGGITKGSFMLTASLADLSAEILAEAGKQPGCALELRFEFPIREFERDCALAAERIEAVWGTEHSTAQTVSRDYGRAPSDLTDILRIRFAQKLDERHIDDIPRLLEHLLLSLERLDDAFAV
ncbi:hypothetical protein [Paenibacillus xerothermodurans]|uniref:Uncharacterized protein n=1 Tax=Paenibacillus xerothermodurans TaxID=1977292 RepID=A0A2W1NQP2_PAEXE|nr:hypothetical protein [Paenibacillus xerothermodurans]PZE21805.1 hypothetical protein CBW46_005195 [Paenibacillus xerothermodurans]